LSLVLFGRLLFVFSTSITRILTPPSVILPASISPFFFFNDPAPTDTYTLSLHDALPISLPVTPRRIRLFRRLHGAPRTSPLAALDRKSTRLNSSHGSISYAVFCLKKKNEQPPYYLSYTVYDQEFIVLAGESGSVPCQHKV